MVWILWSLPSNNVQIAAWLPSPQWAQGNNNFEMEPVAIPQMNHASHSQKTVQSIPQIQCNF